MQRKGLGGELVLDTATIPQIQARMAAGEFTAVELVDAYIDRIRRFDGVVNAVLAVSRRARIEAAESDERRRLGRWRGHVDGIPVLVKDSVDTAAMPTSAGSRALLFSTPAADATVVHRLRAAGAVILGKTNLSEWDNFRSWRCTSGWSGVGGQTNNPHVLDRNPCGSSAGSGAAVAAAMAQVAIGTETDGSLICPAGVNGIVAHKPSLGLVSRTGLVPVSVDQDTAGPMARHVVDAALTLGVLQGRDVADDATAEYPADQPVDYAGELDAGSLCGRRIGVWRLAGCVPEVDRVVVESVRSVQAAGATVVDVQLPLQDEIGSNKIPALVAEFRRDIERYLASRTGVPATLAELIEFNRNDPVELTLFGQEIFEYALTGPSAEDLDNRACRSAAVSLARRSIDETMARHAVDLIMAPTNSPAWHTDYARGDQFALSSASPAAVAGYPSASVPAGSAGPLPIGLSFIGPRWADAAVLSAAFAFEQAAAARLTPRFLPAVDRP